MATLYDVTATALNLRAAPNAGATILTVLRAGQTCVGAGDAVGGWLPVTHDRFSGFVGERFVRVAGSAAAAPAPAAPAPAPVAAAPVPAPAAAPSAISIDPEAKLRDRAQLHPRFRAALDALLEKAAAEGMPFRVFEAYRTPERQEWLYGQGRTRPGAKVSNARAWESFHQYGMAADIVLFIDGRWSWSDAGPLKAHWKRLRELASEVGLRTLSWEAPHVELPVSIAEAAAPAMLASGDDSWLDAMESSSHRWRRAGGRGGPDLAADERPPLPPTA